MKEKECKGQIPQPFSPSHQSIGGEALRVCGVTALTIAFFSVIMPSSAVDNASYEIQIDDAYAQYGTPVMIPVNFTNGGEEIIGIQVKLTYNSSILHISSVEKGELTANWNWSTPRIRGEEGEYEICIVGTRFNAMKNGCSGSFIVLNISAVEGVATLNISDVILSSSSFQLIQDNISVRNGTISVIPFPTHAAYAAGYDGGAQYNGSAHESSIRMNNTTTPAATKQPTEEAQQSITPQHPSAEDTFMKPHSADDQTAEFPTAQAEKTLCVIFATIVIFAFSATHHKRNKNIIAQQHALSCDEQP